MLGTGMAEKKNLEGKGREEGAPRTKNMENVTGQGNCTFIAGLRPGETRE